MMILPPQLAISFRKLLQPSPTARQNTVSAQTERAKRPALHALEPLVFRINQEPIVRQDEFIRVVLPKNLEISQGFPHRIERRRNARFVP